MVVGGYRISGRTGYGRWREREVVVAEIAGQYRRENTYGVRNAFSVPVPSQRRKQVLGQSQCNYPDLNECYQINQSESQVLVMKIASAAIENEPASKHKRGGHTHNVSGY